MPFLTHYLEIFITKLTLLTTATALRKGNMMRGFVHQAIKMPQRKVRCSEVHTHSFHEFFFSSTIRLL